MGLFEDKDVGVIFIHKVHEYMNYHKLLKNFKYHYIQRIDSSISTK